MRVRPIIASRFISDGGSMFGLVPKPIWSKLIPPDEQNGIPQNANVLLVELDDGRRGLLDTGCGDPAAFSDKELAMHGMTRQWPLMDGLRKIGLSPEDISFIVLTHLHWDHAGGVGLIDAHGNTTNTFPNAVHYIHEQEWVDATSGNPLLFKSYPGDTINPLRNLPDTKRVLVHDAAPNIFPGIRMLRSSGHTRGHCVIHLEHDALELQHPEAASFGPLKHVMFTGDVCPTQHHLRMVFQTAYDTYPLDTRTWKRDWLVRAANEGIALFLDHDPADCAALIQADERREFIVTKHLRALNEG